MAHALATKADLAATEADLQSPADGIPDDAGDASDGYLEGVQTTLDEWNSKEDKTAWRDL